MKHPITMFAAALAAGAFPMPARELMAPRRTSSRSGPEPAAPWPVSGQRRPGKPNSTPTRPARP